MTYCKQTTIALELGQAAVLTLPTGETVRVILTSFGLARNESEPYVLQTRSQGRLLSEFRPETGKIRGPHIEIYRVGSER